MAIYLKKFETMNKYNAYTADTENFILPNVSLTVDNNTVHYNTSTPPTPSHDFVEIGGIKWATMNIGANSVTDTGLYFQWGDTSGYTAAQVGEGEGQKYFGIDDYIYTEDGYGSYTKYNSTDGLTTLEAVDDAVKAAWGGNWRMPTVSEFIALGESVTTAWTADYQGSGVAGVVFTSNADGATLFFPAAGSCGYGSVYDVGSSGRYWSSSGEGSCVITNAYSLELSDSQVLWDTIYDRCYGNLVRGVLADN